MEKQFSLCLPGTLDDLNCKDGEIELSLNPTDAIAGVDSIITTDTRALPTGARCLWLHVTTDATINIILLLADATLAYMPYGKDSEPASSPLLITNVTGIKAVTATGDILVILTESQLLFARWTGAGYLWLGATPASPQPTTSIVKKALPPYSYAEGELPRLSVSCSIGKDNKDDVLSWLNTGSGTCTANTRQTIYKAIKEKFREFAEAVGSAGMAITPITTAAAYILADGSLWLRSTPRTLAASTEQVALRIVSADADSGSLYLTLEVNRSPFILSHTLPPIPQGWNGIITGIKTLECLRQGDINTGYLSSPVWVTPTARGFLLGTRNDSADICELPEAYGAMTDAGSPERLHTIGGRLFAITGGHSVSTSLHHLPMVKTGTSRIAGGRIRALTASLRSAALISGGGEEPLYAFCDDGIRALAPAHGTYREVQLISRDTAFAHSITPMADATAFVTPAGIMKIEGTTVTPLLTDADFPCDDSVRLLYIYKERRLCLYRTYADNIICHHYAWPDSYLLTDKGLSRAIGTVRQEEGGENKAETEKTPIPIKTRPIKLGDPFAIKKTEEIEAVWPDGRLYPLKLYGALLPGKWYFLGMAPRGRMLTRGSGWRMFKVETFATGLDLLPLIRLKYAI